MSATSTNNHIELNARIAARDRTVLCDIEQMTRDALENTQHDLLFTAVKSNFTDAVTALIGKGLKSGHALGEAICYQKNTYVRQLLDVGAHVSAVTLQLAIDSYNSEAARWIREKLEMDRAIRMGLDGTWEQSDHVSPPGGLITHM